MDIFDKRLLTTKEVAAVLRVHPTTVYRLMKSGRIPNIKVGSDYRVSSSRLEQLMATQGTVNNKRKR